jgi:hypothetical protein
VVALSVHTLSPKVLERAEVPDVVAGDNEDAVASCSSGERREQRHKLEQLVRLQQQLGVVDGVTHRDRELDLPLADSDGDESVEQAVEVAGRFRANLGVHARIETETLRPSEGAERSIECPGPSTEAIVQRGEPVDRNP